MKKYILTVLTLICFISVKGQELGPNYKIIDIGTNGYGDYTRSLILLHEIYNGTLLPNNYAIGTITAMRGSAVAYQRLNVVNINTASAYTGVSGSIVGYDGSNIWKLKTCIYNGKKYIAVEVPYADAFHDWGYKFCGWTTSSGENMKCVSYEVSGQPVNQNLISNIQDYTSNMTETHSVDAMNITGYVGIGTNTPRERLSVNGKIRAQEVKVETANWPDYVFESSYNSAASLPDLEKYIKTNKHLPEIPPAREIEETGLSLGEMSALQMKKIEELTLYILEQDKKNREQDLLFKEQEKTIKELSSKIIELRKELNQ